MPTATQPPRTPLPNHLCPCCETPLSSEPMSAGFVVWCASLKCQSNRADVGAIGSTPEAAAADLIKDMETKPDWDE
jgi:hypothetical protein